MHDRTRAEGEECECAKKNSASQPFGGSFSQLSGKKKKNVFFGISDQQAAPLLWPDAALDAIVKY